MSNLMNRVKRGFQRVGDSITGQDVEVASEAPRAELLSSRATARPALDVLENEDELLLVADVPGAVPDTTHVNLESGRLTILARVPPPPKAHLLLGSANGEDWYVALSMPDIVAPDGVTAALREGVLEIRLPKRERPAPRHVPVAT